MNVRGRVALALLLAVGSASGEAQQRAHDRPSNVSMGSGNQQSASAGSWLPEPIVVRILDARGRPVPHTLVGFSAPDGGMLSAVRVFTDAKGTARTRYRVPDRPQRSLRIVATLGDSAVGPIGGVVFIASSHPGPPAAIVPVPLEEASAGEVVTVAARVEDAYGNGVSARRVVWEVTGTGSVHPPTSITDRNGVATTRLTIGPPGQETRLTARHGALMAVFAVTPSSAGQTSDFVAVRGRAFGIARSADGTIAASLIQPGALTWFPEHSPGDSHELSLGGTPTVVALDRGGQTAFVANMSGWVDVVDLVTEKLSRVELAGAHSLALAPDGQTLWVASSRGTLSAIDVATRAVTRTIEVPGGPWGIAFRPARRDPVLYVSSRNAQMVTEIDLRTGSAERRFDVAGRPHGIAVDSRGTRLYVAENQRGTIVVVDLETSEIAQTIALPGAFGIAISPDDRTIYVSTDDGRLFVVDAASGRVAQSLGTHHGRLRQLVCNADGSLVYGADDVRGVIATARR